MTLRFCLKLMKGKTFRIKSDGIISSCFNTFSLQVEIKVSSSKLRFLVYVGVKQTLSALFEHYLNVNLLS